MNTQPKMFELTNTSLLDPTIEQAFSEEVIHKYNQQPESGYIDVILELCEKYELEPETIPRLISEPIKELIQQEATNKNLLRGQTKQWSLPV